MYLIQLRTTEPLYSQISSNPFVVKMLLFPLSGGRKLVRGIP